MRTNSAAIPNPPPVPKSVLNDYRWADSHHLELAKKYPEKWVAVVGRRVVAYGKRADRVLAQAHRQTNRADVALLFVESRLHLY